MLRFFCSPAAKLAVKLLAVQTVGNAACADEANAFPMDDPSSGVRERIRSKRSEDIDSYP
jgi:hypothetical protein